MEKPCLGTSEKQAMLSGQKKNFQGGGSTGCPPLKRRFKSHKTGRKGNAVTPQNGRRTHLERQWRNHWEEGKGCKGRREKIKNKLGKL